MTLTLTYHNHSNYLWFYEDYSDSDSFIVAIFNIIIIYYTVIWDWILTSIPTAFDSGTLWLVTRLGWTSTTMYWDWDWMTGTGTDDSRRVELNAMQQYVSRRKKPAKQRCHCKGECLILGIARLNWRSANGQHCKSRLTPCFSCKLWWSCLFMRLRLWNMQCSHQYPVTGQTVQQAIQQGLTKCSASETLETTLPTFDHKPMLQCAMDQTVQEYEAPCWVQGVCRKSSVHSSSQLLHRSLMQSIKGQLQKRLPSKVVKVVLISGDVVVAIRFPQNELESKSKSASSSTTRPVPLVPSRSCRIFFLPKVVLRPEYAIFMELDVDYVKQTATFKTDQETGFAICRSGELAAELLSLSPPPTALWLNILKYTAQSLGRSLICWLLTRYARNSWWLWLM